MKRFLIVLFLFFYGCEDKYVVSIYDKDILKEKKRCLQIKLNPFTNKVYDTIYQLYDFSQNCKYSVVLRYKTKIACNSPYKTGNFDAFVEFSVYKDNKLVAVYYLDTTTKDFDNDLKELFTYMKKNINLE